MNLDAARRLARTKDFSQVRPWGTSVDMLTLVEYFCARVHRTNGSGWGYTLDIYSESSIAIELGRTLRLQGGWRGQLVSKKQGKDKEKAKEKADEKRQEKDGEEADELDGAPPSILQELHRGVPTFLLGFPVLQAPKALRYLFFLELPIPVYEAALVASHPRAASQVCPARYFSRCPQGLCSVGGPHSEIPSDRSKVLRRSAG